MNTIIAVQSGVHFTPYSGAASYDLNKNGTRSDRIVTTGVAPMSTVSLNTNQNTWGMPVEYVNVGDWKPYTCPASVNNGQWCNPPLGRNSMTGPAYQKVDFGVSKKFKVTERSSFTLQGNFFNLLNHTNFGLPTRNYTSSNFGKITSAYDPRITQLALRFDF